MYEPFVKNIDELIREIMDLNPDDDLIYAVLCQSDLALTGQLDDPIKLARTVLAVALARCLMTAEKKFWEALRYAFMNAEEAAKPLKPEVREKVSRLAKLSREFYSVKPQQES